MISKNSCKRIEDLKLVNPFLKKECICFCASWSCQYKLQNAQSTFTYSNGWFAVWIIYLLKDIFVQRQLFLFPYK